MAEARASTKGRIQLSARWNVLRGHAYGLRGPVLCGAVRWPTNARWNTQALAAMLCHEGGLDPVEVQRCLASGVSLDTFLALVPALEKAAQSPVRQVGIQVAPATQQNGVTGHSIALQSFQPRFTQTLMKWLVSAINLCQDVVSAKQRSELGKSVHAKLDEGRAAWRAQMNTGGVNWTRIVRACNEMDLPSQLLPGGFINVGSGPNARLFKSTLTESTPALSVRLARSKSLTASVLALHGLPVPTQKIAESAQAAVDAAHALGYPVVVKPDDRDGGSGVYAGLRTDEQVGRCYAQAVAISPTVLVETHIEGQDFRITVDKGKVVKAIGRRPGGVLGDGRQTVEQLVNAAAAAKPAMRGSASIVHMDDEARELLAERGMTARNVPEPGEFIVLRRRANMSTGGTSRDVIGELHPDNARLAVRAAQALRLDLAGVDLIIPDLSVSWMECKAAICEVNAQPQISTEFATSVYRDILARMVPEPRRMRATLLLNASGIDECDAGVVEAAKRLMQSGERVLSVRSDGTWLGQERFAPAGRSAFAAAVAAELEPEATAVVVALTPKDVLQHGLPWLHVDQVHVLGGAHPLERARAQQLKQCLEMISPHAVLIESAPHL